MQNTPSVNILPTQEELERQKENLRAWTRVFKELNAYALEGSQTGSCSIQVQYDPDQLGEKIEEIKTGSSEDILDDLGEAVFIVSCGKSDSDMVFYFTRDICAVNTYHNAAIHAGSDHFASLIQKLLMISDIQKINCFKETYSSNPPFLEVVDKNPPTLRGNACFEYCTLNDGLLILKHWIAVCAGEMTKAKPQVELLPD